MYSSGTTWTFTYDANGMRTSRYTNGGTEYTYVYNGSQLSMMTYGSNTLYFAYDAAGTPMTVNYNGTTYYYVTNLQGDVIAILNSVGTAMVQYTYDAWGKPLTTTGSMSGTLGVYNPLRYRGYVYDTETGLYYLQSRYYNPTWGRFISADSYISTGQGILGCNMFAYCNNNPINAVDPSGHALVYVSVGFYDDPTLTMFFGGGGGGGGYFFVAVDSLKEKIADYDWSKTTSVGVVVGTSNYGHTTGATGCITTGSSGDFAIQGTQTIGESTCLTPGASIGVCTTFSTANDVQHMVGVSDSVGFTVCVGCGLSFDLAWFETPSGREYAFTFGVLVGAELEVHGAISNTVSTKSWNLFD